MTEADKIFEKMVEIAQAETSSFEQLVRIAGLDPARDFRNALLSCDLSGVDLNDFDLTGARLHCNLDGADLTETRGVTKEMLNSAKVTPTTKLPWRFFWENGNKPKWAAAWGDDQYGRWVGFRLPNSNILRRMRWCPPGRFVMCSPRTEGGRWPEEGVQRDVRIHEGFWMFDVPCTQGLWSGVMGTNPSEFRKPSRPVEHVNYDDAKNFTIKINSIIPDLNLDIPAEEQWEYACRAGTKSATYTGDMVDQKNKIDHQNLDLISWYQSNSYGITREVGKKLPNPWGLYDMLGNVWEWCTDIWQELPKGAPRDLQDWGLRPDGILRIIRGGSWNSDPSQIRAAHWSKAPSEYTSNQIGFRCIRVGFS